MTSDLTTEQMIGIVAAGVIGNLVYQGVMFYMKYNDEGKFPWSDRPHPVGVIMFIFTTIFKLFAAGYVVWVLAQSGQIGGLIGATIIGMAGEEMVISFAAAGRKVAKNVSTA